MSEHDKQMEQLKIIEGLQHKILKSINFHDPSEVLTMKMIVKQYHVSRPTIHKHMNSGMLKFHKIGRGNRFYRGDVDQWLKK